jgi:hypothetical protein
VPVTAPAASPLLTAFDFQVQWCREPAPFTSRVLQRTRQWLAADAAAHAAFSAHAGDPLAAAMALRWAGALHHLALRGLPPWAGLWPPGGKGSGATDAELDAAIRSAWQDQQPTVQAALTRPPQTNEVRRSVALLPGLLWVAARAGLPLNLLEIGASAGLNLWCDHYRHEHGRWSWGDHAAALTLHCDWQGSVPEEASTNLQIIRRAACDANPIALDHPDEGLRLASFIWPEQADRLVRLNTARTEVARLMAARGVAVEALPAADFLARELDAPLPGCATVVMHSVVWQYIPAAEQAAITATVEAAGARASAAAPLFCLRFEPRAGDGHVELRCRRWPDGADHLLARCHPHGAHVDWLADATG